MFHGGIKYSTEVSNIPRGGLNILRRYEIFYGGGKIFHGGMKYFPEGVTHSTDV